MGLSPLGETAGAAIRGLPGREIRLEIYDTVRDPALDRKVEAALTAADIPYEADFSFLESEGLYESIFEIEV